MNVFQNEDLPSGLADIGMESKMPPNFSVMLAHYTSLGEPKWFDISFRYFLYCKHFEFTRPPGLIPLPK